MSLSVGLAGIQVAQTDIDAIGNNISNTQTNGFKNSVAQFSDLYANSISNTTPGLGVATAGLAQNFSEGTVRTTGNSLDVAISGSGFFQLQTPTGLAYGRDGSFQLDGNGFLVNDAGAQVMGFGPNASGGASTSGLLQPIQISTANIAPTATANLGMVVNLPTSDPAIDTTTTPFNPSNPNSYDESTSASIFDSLGQSRTLTTYFTQAAGSGAPNNWQTNWQLTGADGSVVASGAGPVLSFNSAGKLLSGTGTIAVGSLPNGAAPLSVALDFTGSSLSNLPFGINSVTDDGTGGGQFTGVAIADNGVVTGQYSDGGTQTFSTIALANFINPQGLAPISGNMWLASAASGAAASGAPATGGLGQLQTGSLEGSNVDLSSELVNLIIAQQAYQANVQGINIERQDIQRLLSMQ